MSNNIFNLDPTTHQASLSKVNIGASEDASLIVLGKVTKVYYHQGTLDFKLTSGVSSIVADGSGNGTGSARIPLDYFGQDSEGRTYGHYRPVQIGDTVAIAYLNGHKTSPIVIGVYAPNGEQYEAISPTLFDSGDDKDDYIAETGLAEQHVHHSGQISYRSGSGRLFESLNGYSFMVIDDDTSQDYSELYTDLSLVPYSSIDGKTHDPQREKAGDWLLVHEDNPNGLDVDNHITRFYVNKAGDFELVFTNTSFTGVSTVLHMDKNGMQLNKYIGHQRKKAGLPRASEEDQTYTADFDSAPTTVTFDLGKTKDDTISLKSSTTFDSKEQATNLEVRTDGVYINDVKLFDSKSNSLAALSMFLDGGVMDFSKITVKNFSGDNIEDGTIDGTKLKDKAITSDKLKISKLSDISSDMGTITAGSIMVNNGTAGSTGVTLSGDASSDPNILTPHDKAQLQQQLNALYSQCQALVDYGTTVGIDVSELKTNENSLKNLTDWVFETDGNVKVDRVKIDEAITNFTGLLETYRNKFTSQLNQKVGETSNKANSIYQGSQAPDQANVKEGDLWLQTNSDGTSNLMQYTNSVWQEANLKGYQEAKTAAEQAQEAADKLPHNYYQATEPSGTQYNDGDLWYQSVSSTSDGKTKYNVYKWDIFSKKWVQFIDNNVNNNYVASSAPADPNDGDFWTDTDGTLKQYQNGKWVVVPTQGPQGIPGTDGKTSYTHIAYATSADGKSNFSVDSFSGASYIGLLVDFTEEDSSDPTKYTWSLMKGTDGTDGKDGVPGKPGADGKTSYVHFAYANSSDGTNGFNLTYFANALYVGTYTDFTEADSSDHTKYTWSRLKGEQGDQGIRGPVGADGKSSYTHIAYANSLDGKTDFTVSDSNRSYIGMYVDFTATDSNDPTKYAWSLIKGADGTDGKDGVPGKPGADGKTPYFHIAYADSSDGTANFSNDTPGSRKYIGSYTDFTQADSTNPALYSWQLVQGPKGDQGDQGIPGAKGVDGKTYYTWIKYATDSSGSNMSDSPTGMSYIGIAPNKESSTESSTPTDYKWSLIKGADGIPGAPGADGKTSYFHIAYANSADGKNGFYVGGGTNLLLGTVNSLSITGTNIVNQCVNKYLLDNGYNVSSLASALGTQFTVSFDWSVSGSSPSGGFYAQWNDVPWQINPVLTKVSGSNTSGHISNTFSISTSSGNVATNLGFRLDNFVGTLKISNVKLEKGNVATPWSPAPTEAHPLYMGTYTDYTLLGSTDPTKYTWVPMFDSSKKRNFTTTPTTPYDVGDTWTTSGSTYFCKTARPNGAFNQSDWTLQQLTIQSLDSNLQANINGDKNLLMVDDVTYYSSPALDSNIMSTGSNNANGIGVNYLRDSDKSISGWVQDLGTIPNEVLNSLAGETITVSVDVEWSNYQHSDSKQNRLGFELAVTGSDGKSYWWGVWKSPVTPSGKERVSATYTLPANVTFTVDNNGRSGYVSINGTGTVSHAKIEKGSVATPWSPAPEDVCYPFDYTSTDTTYTFQVQAKSTVSGDYVHMYPAWGNTYGQSQDKTTQVSVTTSPSVPNQTTTFNSADSDTKLLLTTDWVTYTCTISGTWDKGSVLTALLGQVYNSEAKGTVSFRNIKLVAGNAIKDYTSDDSITVAQGSNYWDLTTLQKGSSVNRGGLNLLTNTDKDISVTSHTTDGWPAWANIDTGFSFEHGKTYTFSTEANNSNNNITEASIRIFEWTTNTQVGIYAFPADGERHSVTFTIPNDSHNYHLLIYAGHAGIAPGVDVTTTYHHLKLELGNVATPWSPAPGDSNYASWLQNRYYTPWYPISEGQRVFLTHYDYPAYPGVTTSASVEFADSDHNFISNGTNNSQGSSTLDGTNSKFINPQSLNGVYYNERMLNISIVSEAWTSGTYQDLYIQTSGLLQSKLAVSRRGVTLATFDPYSGQRVDTQYWDTYATVDNANALVSYLKSISSQDLVVAIATRDSFIQDSTDFQTASQDLCTLLQSYGLPSTYAPADLRGRVSFAFVGHTPAYQGNSNETLLSSSKGDNQVSTLTAYVSNGHISSTNNTRLVAYANAPAKTAYFRAGYSFSPDEVNRVNFMVTVDKLSTSYSSNIADVSSNAVRKDVTYKGVTLNDNGLTATADKTQVIVNSSNGFAIKKSGVDVFSVDTNGNLTITGSTISTGNISGVDFSGQDLTLSGTLSVNGSIVAANGSFTIDQNGMEVSPQGGGSFVISKGGLTIQGSSVGSQSTAGTYGSNDSLAGDAGLFATKDKAGNTKTWITSSGTLIAQDAVIHGNVSVDKLTLTGQNSEIVFGSGFKIDGNGAMTSTSKNAQISNGTYSDGVIEGSELDIGTSYHSMLSNADKYRYHVSNIGETTFGMAQDVGLMSITPDINKSYLSLDNSWAKGQVNFRGTGKAPNNANQVLSVTGDIYTDEYGWKHRFSAPVNGVSDTRNYIPIWDKDKSGTIPSYTFSNNIIDPVAQWVGNVQSGSWGGNGLPNWTLGTVEFPDLAESLFTFSDKSTLYPDHNQTIKLKAGEPYVFGAYIWHCGLRNGAKVTIMTSSSDTSLQDTHYVLGNIVGYQQSGYSLVSYVPSSDVYLHSVYVEAGVAGGNQGDNYGVPLSVTDPFAIDLYKFTSKLFGGGLDTLTSLGGHFGMPYPHLDKSQHGVLGLMATDHLNAGDIIIVSLPINYANKQTTNFPQINLGIAKPGNDDVYIPIDGEFQPLMPGYYTYDFYFVWKDEYINYINSNMIQLNLISNGVYYSEKAYVVSVDSVRMGIFTGSPTTSSSYFVNEYQTKFSPLGSLQLSHLNTGAIMGGYTVAGQTQLTSEGLTVSSSFTHMDDKANVIYSGMHVAINGKTGISVGGTTNNDPNNQPTLSIYGSAPYDNLLKSTIEPTYTISNDGSTTACGIWFDSYGNIHGYDSSQDWNVRSPSWKTQFMVPIHDGNGYNISMTDQNGNPGSNSLSIGLIHFNKFGGGYVGGNYPAIYSGSGDQLAGIAFGAGYVIIFGNRNTNNNFWSFPQGGGDGHSSDSGTVSLVTN